MTNYLRFFSFVFLLSILIVILAYSTAPNNTFSTFKIEKSSRKLTSECKCRQKDEYFLKRADLSKLQLTCDLFNSFRRGKGQKIIGYSLFGKKERYIRLLSNVSLQIMQYYPGWTMRVYHDSSIPNGKKCELECLKDSHGKYVDNVDFCNIESLPVKGELYQTWNAKNIVQTIWRWFPIGDSFVNVFSSRDSDSIILQREVDASSQWLASNKPGHIMRGRYI